MRLNFPGSVQENEDSSATYNPSSGTLSVKLSKSNKGQVFPDLDLLSKLLAPVPARNKSASIEVLGVDEHLGSDDADVAEISTDFLEKLTISDSEFQQGKSSLSQSIIGSIYCPLLKAVELDWQLPQSVTDEPEPNLSATYTYGFLGLYSGYLKYIHLSENEVNELGEMSENSSPSERRKAREDHENRKFDDDYYLCVSCFLCAAAYFLLQSRLHGWRNYR